MSENLLTVSARSGFTCHFQYNQGESPLFVKLSFHMTARLEVFFMGDLACTSVTFDDRDSKISGVTALILPGESAPYLICLMMDKASTGCLIVPKVPNFIGGSPKLSDVLLHDCKRSPGKSAPFLLSYLSHYGEGVNGLLPFYTTNFLVYTSYIMFCEE